MSASRERCRSSIAQKTDAFKGAAERCVTDSYSLAHNLEIAVCDTERTSKPPLRDDS